MKTKKWIYLNKGYDPEEIKQISSKYNVPPLIATILMNRNIKTDTEIQLFLKQDLDQLRDPFMLKGMSEAIDRILDAVENDQKITVYGDYDVDGITSSAILTDFLRGIGAEVDYYIPDRIDEGYGINISAVDRIVENGTKLIITVDCGITAIDEVKHAKEKGVDFVITDHHQCNGEFDFACAVVNPNRPDCDYPFKELAGVGVVYKLIMAICASIGEDTKAVSDKYMDLVALGTIADVVRLVDENRIIVSNGIEKIKNTKNIGLQQILVASGLDFDLAYRAADSNSPAPCAMNAANEIAVAAFLNENISFDKMVGTVIETTEKFMTADGLYDVDALFEIDREAREIAKQLISR